MRKERAIFYIKRTGRFGIQKEAKFVFSRTLQFLLF